MSVANTLTILRNNLTSAVHNAHQPVSRAYADAWRFRRYADRHGIGRVQPLTCTQYCRALDICNTAAAVAPDRRCDRPWFFALLEPVEHARKYSRRERDAAAAALAEYELNVRERDKSDALLMFLQLNDEQSRG